MPNGKVRALCAQIALELDPQQADSLIAQLKRLLKGESVTIPTPEIEDKLADNDPRSNLIH